MTATSYGVVNIASTGSPLAISDQVVCADPARLYTVYINTALSNHVLYIQDVSSGSPESRTTVLTIPAQAAAGTVYTFPGLEFKNQLVVRRSNAAATGSITLAYAAGTRVSLKMS